jgi:hypothetical protein
VWLSTTYVQILAVTSTLWQNITCGVGGGDAWTVVVPTWPLNLVFFLEFACFGGAIFWARSVNSNLTKYYTYHEVAS